MSDFSKARVAGTVDGTPTIRRGDKNGKPWNLCGLKIASKPERGKPLWIEATGFGEMGDALARYAAGEAICVEGQLETQSWEGKDGKRVYKVALIVSDVLSDRAAPTAAPPPARPAPAKETPPDVPPGVDPKTGEVLDESEIPF